MFLELHLNDEKIMLNMNAIKSIYQVDGVTRIYVGEVIYEVKESYEDIVKAINNWNGLAKA